MNVEKLKINLELVASLVTNIDQQALCNLVDFLALKATVNLLIRLDHHDPWLSSRNTVGCKDETTLALLTDEIIRQGLLYLQRNCPSLFR